MKKGSFREKLSDTLFNLIPIGELLIFAGGAIGYLMILVIIFLNAHKLRYFFLPVLIVYILPIFVAKYLISRRDNRNRIRALGGEELFAELYPREAQRQAKRLEKQKNRAEKKLQKNKEQEAKNRGPEL